MKPSHEDRLADARGRKVDPGLANGKLAMRRGHALIATPWRLLPLSLLSLLCLCRQPTSAVQRKSTATIHGDASDNDTQKPALFSLLAPIPVIERCAFPSPTQPQQNLPFQQLSRQNEHPFFLLLLLTSLINGSFPCVQKLLSLANSEGEAWLLEMIGTRLTSKIIEVALKHTMLSN